MVTKRKKLTNCLRTGNAQTEFRASKFQTACYEFNKITIKQHNLNLSDIKSK